MRADIDRVMENGRASRAGWIIYRDYGEQGSQERLATAMAGAGITEPAPNRAAEPATPPTTRYRKGSELVEDQADRVE
ncbi:hypothetical protein ACWDO0_04900 [Nocardia rhamnosiphila]|uniref:hypothetical protein n=1 Tax=Nocardia rhamnosiphila TaxID=426716 RepID=UPI0033FF2021